MLALTPALRNNLEKTVVAARDLAEAAARVALHRLAVDEREAYPSLNEEQRALRVTLRARARQLGDPLDKAQPDPASIKTMPALTVECAYEQWHRLLFARFLAENNLLMHPEGVPVSLAECEELAADEGLPDGWAVATRYAARMLPQIFRPDDPLLKVGFAPESRQALEKLPDTLPSTVFTADDSLGWVYQFWQARRKEQVNASGEKIDASTISAVTQLFTEHYMVQFLLHNSLGAWWAARHPGEALPLSPDDADYLRRLDDGTPAAGSFPGWPERASELRILDPCGGSGHFVVAALDLMTRIRMREEGLSEREATDAVLRDNLFMLEIDQRCTQIAVFALALAAWKRGGYRHLPQLQVACSGIRIGATKDEWLALARGEGQRSLRWGLRQLYDAFKQAPDLGSLIDPRKAMELGWETVPYADLQPLLATALQQEEVQVDPDRAAISVVAQGLAKAAELLVRQYHLVITNVPYLKRGNQASTLYDFCEHNYAEANADLATVFVERCRSLTVLGGTCALVTPQTWLFLGTYKKLRARLLRECEWNLLARLGARAFRTISGEVVNVVMLIFSSMVPAAKHTIHGLEISKAGTPGEKDLVLRSASIQVVNQEMQLGNPDARITLDSSNAGQPLEGYAWAYAGIRTGDAARFSLCFWELPSISRGWVFWQSTYSAPGVVSGCEHVLLWENGVGKLAEYQKQLAQLKYASGGWKQGGAAWGKKGVLVSQMGSLPVSLYMGDHFDNNSAAIIPYNPNNLPAIWAFCSSPDFNAAVRRIDQKMNVTNATLVKVPFDLGRWQQVADEADPLPRLHSDDPTQWLFKGQPATSTASLQVAVARLLGYSWPEQADDDLREFVDEDGIVPLPAVSGELAAAERLRALLTCTYGDAWSHSKEQELLSAVEFAGKSLDLWLRDGYFKQHCRLFHNRPFIWHIWDGRRDGFSALVNYHKLDKRLLEKLTYTYVDDWIARQQESVRRGEDGADARLIAIKALQDKLKLILEGEPPYDIYVRWKQLHEQPIGWEPDLNDGVRLNIRPFMTAGILRAEPNIKRGIDRGKNPDGSARNNDVHHTLQEKQDARKPAM